MDEELGLNHEDIPTDDIPLDIPQDDANVNVDVEPTPLPLTIEGHPAPEIPTPTIEEPSTVDDYNPASNEKVEQEKELGSCDCRSECKYNTGETWKSSDYGYSD